jgi:hypothetical protein
MHEPTSAVNLTLSNAKGKNPRIFCPSPRGSFTARKDEGILRLRLRMTAPGWVVAKP